MQELAGHLVSPQNSATQARSRLPKDHSLPGHSPSPAALAAMEGLISSAVRKGHLSPLYVQPLLVKGESCLSSQQNASLKEGKTLSLKRKIFFWQCCKAYEILVPWPGIKLRLPTLEVWSVNHWTPREVPKTLSLTGPPSRFTPIHFQMPLDVTFSVRLSLELFFFLKVFFNWWKIALQFWVGFCHNVNQS